VSQPLRVFIADDERLAREGVRALAEGERDVTVVGEGSDGPSTVAAIRAGGVEILFLDIQMPGMDGFEVLRAIPEAQLPVVVFLTAHDQFALKAFDANALDYVVKPFSDARFRSALARARKQVHQRRLGEAGAGIAELVGLLRDGSMSAERTPAAASPPRAGRFIDRIPVRSVGRVVYVRVADVVWIGSADYYVELHTADGKTHLVRDSLQRIEERLDPSVFARVHRTAIARIDQIAELRTDSSERQFIVLRNGTRLPLGKSRREALEQVLASR
jgi:two-component system LytT family response regulator